MKTTITIIRQYKINCNPTTCGKCWFLIDFSQRFRQTTMHVYKVYCDAFRVPLERRKRDAMPLRCEECLRVAEEEKP